MSYPPASNSVIRRLGTTESTMLAFKREVGGKIRVASLLGKRRR